MSQVRGEEEIFESDGGGGGFHPVRFTSVFLKYIVLSFPSSTMLDIFIDCCHLTF